MAKKDLSKELQALYFPSAKEPAIVNVPPMQFAMIDGVGDPNTSKDFQEAIGALYGIAYTAKFAAKKAGIRNVLVMPLEALWWAEGAGDFPLADKGKWHWTAMLMEPADVTRQLFDDSVRQLREKKNPPGLSKVRLDRFHEGPSVQILYIGPYTEEGPTIARLRKYIDEHGYKLAGKHHEIYLGDPRRTEPSRLKTVIRLPVKR